MANEIRLYQFEVEVLRTGQERKYGDSYYDYIVINKSEINYSDYVVETFCRGFLEPAKPKSDKDRAWHESYYTFRKIADRKYEYKVVSPSTH